MLPRLVSMGWDGMGWDGIIECALQVQRQWQHSRKPRRPRGPDRPLLQCEPKLSCSVGPETNRPEAAGHARSLAARGLYSSPELQAVDAACTHRGAASNLWKDREMAGLRQSGKAADAWFRDLRSPFTWSEITWGLCRADP